MTTDTPDAPPPLVVDLADQAGLEDPVSRETGVAGDQLLDAEAIAQSFTGFDEIAIQQAFRVRDLGELGETLQMRACWFIHRRRQGATDVEAYREAMTTTLGELVPKFRNPKAEQQDGGDTGPEA